MPAPPARMRSASVPCGLNSISSSPARYCWANSLVLADIGRDHLLDLPRLEQQAEAGAVDAGIVGDDGEVLHAGVADRLDQRLRDAAQAEAAGHDQHAVLEHAGERRLCVGIDFLHALPALGPEIATDAGAASRFKGAENIIRGGRCKAYLAAGYCRGGVMSRTGLAGPRRRGGRRPAAAARRRGRRRRVERGRQRQAVRIIAPGHESGREQDRGQERAGHTCGRSSENCRSGSPRRRSGQDRDIEPVDARQIDRKSIRHPLLPIGPILAQGPGPDHPPSTRVTRLPDPARPAQVRTWPGLRRSNSTVKQPVMAGRPAGPDPESMTPQLKCVARRSFGF